MAKAGDKTLLKVRGIALLAVAALLLHMLLPFYAYYPSPIGQGRPNSLSQNQPPAAALFGNRVLICTADGFKLINLTEGTGEAEQSSGRDPSKPHKPYQCPLCYVAAHGLATPPVTIAALSLPSLFDTPIVTALISHDSLAGEARWYRLRTRSPPTAIG
jgi:hypothetical protein